MLNIGCATTVIIWLKYNTQLIKNLFNELGFFKVRGSYSFNFHLGHIERLMLLNFFSYAFCVLCKRFFFFILKHTCQRQNFFYTSYVSVIICIVDLTAWSGSRKNHVISKGKTNQVCNLQFKFFSLHMRQLGETLYLSKCF